MNRNGVIISGGTIESAFALSILKEVQPEYVIGVDRGLTFLYQNQVMPTHIVGDFDSISPHIIDFYRKKTTIPIQQFRPEKDQTDTEIAVRLALELGITHLWILGATGTRLDHVLANIQVLKIAHDAGAKAYIIDGHNRISLIEKEAWLTKDNAYGTYFSLFPFGGSVEGLSIKGAKYPLKGHTVTPYDSRCVSNEWEEDVVEITFPSGTIILMETRE